MAAFAGLLKIINQKGKFESISLIPFLCFLFVYIILFTGNPFGLYAETNGGKKQTLTATFDKGSINVGGVADLFLDYTLPEGAELISPIEIKGLEEFTIIDTILLEKRIHLKLLADRLGSLTSGEIELSYTDPEGNRLTLKTDPVSLNVLSNLGDKPEEAQLRPIQDIIPLRSFWIRYWPPIIAASAIIIAGLCFFFWYMRRKTRNLTAELYDPPHVKAKKAIAELEARMLFENGDVKGFYFRFSEIIRQYLENLRDFPAVEYTTEEISSRLQADQDRILIQLLKNADLAKFADFKPSNNRKEEEVKTILSYIDETCTAFEPDHQREQIRGNSL